MQATWNGHVVAESDQTEVVEGNHYFPATSLKQEFFSQTATTTVCPWKGGSTYYSLTADGTTATDAAWAYLDPKSAAENIRGHVAFGRDVTVSPA